MTDYNEILTSAGKFRINLGLERIKAVLALLNNPQKNCKFIHIAGTNGKGSTSKIINDILIEHFGSKHKIGLFTSPHLFSYCERIKINNENIPEEEFSRLINRINDLALKNNVDLTEFELICAVAFYYFSINNVEYAVIEVGLGGLYDATNIIENPLVSVITTIDFDHTERLGKTIDEIARQKAGIIKQNSKVVISKENLGFKVIQKEALKKNSILIKVPDIKIEFKDFSDNFAIVGGKKYKFNLLGSHQKDNLSLALGAIKALNIGITENSVENALKKICWDFRLDYRKNKNLLIDGAHNPNGIKALKTFVDENLINIEKTIIFGCLKNKDYPKMLETLLKDENNFYFFEFDYPNALKYNELPEKYKAKAKVISTVREVQNIINSDEHLKIICGSLYMLGQVFKDYKF